MKNEMVNLLCGLIKGIGVQIHLFLQDQSKKGRHNFIEQSPILIRLPLRINFFLKPGKTLFSSLEVMQHISLISEDVQILKLYATERGLSTEEALLQIIQSIISEHHNIQEINKMCSPKKKIVIGVELWDENKEHDKQK